MSGAVPCRKKNMNFGEKHDKQTNIDQNVKIYAS